MCLNNLHDELMMKLCDRISVEKLGMDELIELNRMLRDSIDGVVKNLEFLKKQGF